MGRVYRVEDTKLKQEVALKLIKPEIASDGTVRIMDFGIARSLTGKGITGAGMIIGTPEYMSPEQVEAKDIDQHSDIYSLGIILYEMTTGKLPFEADSPFAVGIKQKSEKTQDPRELNPQIPEDLSQIILRCLEKEKENRYQHASDLHAELERIQKGMPTTTKAISTKKPLTSKEITVTFGLKKLLIPSIIFLTVIIIGLILWQVLPRKKEAPVTPSGQPSLAVMYFQNETGDEALDHWKSALSQWLITDISQSKHLYVIPADQLFSILRRLDLLDARTYASEDLAWIIHEPRLLQIRGVSP